MKIRNSVGEIYYGMHFYPGVAEYSEAGVDPYRVFLNEDTIRTMDPTFAGRPIFVEHVDEVADNSDALRKDADGWVVESFYNSADGKHWVKFIVLSERAKRAIGSGMRLSNAYIPKTFRDGGLWNGVAYAKEVTGGEYEHLAIVRNPRYEESVIMSPDEFKDYNEKKTLELKRLANSKEKENPQMKFSLFKREKIENTLDIENTLVVLPKSKKEISLSDAITNADEAMVAKASPLMASADHMVKMNDGSEMKVGDLLAKHKSLQDELDVMKKKKEDGMKSEDEAGLDIVEDKFEVAGDKHNDGMGDVDMDLVTANEDEDDKEKKDAEAKKKNTLDAEKKKANLAKLQNAQKNAPVREAVVDLLEDQVARGKARYGSDK